MSEPTNVTSSTNVTDSGSSSSPASSWNEPAGIQENRSRSRDRWSTGRPSRFRNSSRPQTNAAQNSATASQCPHRSVRRPPSSSTAAPSAGRATSSQAPDCRTPDAVSYTPRTGSSAATRAADGTASGAANREVTGAALSVLEQVGVVHGCRPPGAEDRHDDREPDDDLGRGDEHDEQRDDLTVEVALHPREGDEGQVRRVEHELDAHEHDDRVAPDEHGAGADGEEQRGQVQPPDQAHRGPPARVRTEPAARSGPSPRPGVPAPPWAPTPVALGPDSPTAPRSSPSGSSSSVTVVPTSPLSSSVGRICPRAVSTRETDSSLGVPSGSRAGMSTALCRAKTPGAGSGALIGPSLIRRSESSRWVGLAMRRSRCASTMAPRAAVMSSAPVTSNAHT